MKVLVLCVATGKYGAYARTLRDDLAGSGADFVAFQDGPHLHFSWPHLPWPLSTMLRYHAYLRYVTYWERADLVLAMDADLRVVQPLDFAAMAGETVGTLHPGFTGPHAKPGSFETRPESACYVAPEARGAYFAGGLVGGSPAGFRRLCTGIVERIDTDLKNHIIPVWHDESALNAYFAEHPPNTILGPEYLTPDEKCSWYRGDRSKAKILAVSKDHAALRT